MPAPLPQQRAAAALQLGMASGDSPKGVGSVAVQTLVSTSWNDCLRTASLREKMAMQPKEPWERSAWSAPMALPRLPVANKQKMPDPVPMKSHRYPTDHTILMGLTLRPFVATSPTMDATMSASLVEVASDRVAASWGGLTVGLEEIRTPLILTIMITLVSSIAASPAVVMPLALDVTMGRVLWRGGADAANLTLNVGAAACDTTRLAPCPTRGILVSVLALADELRNHWRLLQMVDVIVTVKGRRRCAGRLTSLAPLFGRTRLPGFTFLARAGPAAAELMRRLVTSAATSTLVSPHVRLSNRQAYMLILATKALKFEGVTERLGPRRLSEFAGTAMCLGGHA